jgi:hypothetical protein
MVKMVVMMMIMINTDKLWLLRINHWFALKFWHHFLLLNVCQRLWSLPKVVKRMWLSLGRTFVDGHKPDLNLT